MPGRRSLQALWVAAALAGCSGEMPLLGKAPEVGPAGAALQADRSTVDTPNFDPFQETAPGTVASRVVLQNPSLAEIMRLGYFGSIQRSWWSPWWMPLTAEKVAPPIREK